MEIMNCFKEKKVSILLAIYNPNMEWLRQLLCSLEKQTYKNIYLFARDDCSNSVDFEEIEAIFKECLNNLKWDLKKNERNMGSNKTFQFLTEEADGELFAYCDQDDIWKENKIEILVDLIQSSKSILVYSDMQIIDGQGKIISNTIKDFDKKRIFKRGDNLIEYLLVKNFITGCTMLVNSSVAKKALPFADCIFHDYWISLISSLNGKIDYSSDQLIFYRIHENNQSLILGSVLKKSDYIKEVVNNDKKKM